MSGLESLRLFLFENNKYYVGNGMDLVKNIVVAIICDPLIRIAGSQFMGN